MQTFFLFYTNVKNLRARRATSRHILTYVLLNTPVGIRTHAHDMYSQDNGAPGASCLPALFQPYMLGVPAAATVIAPATTTTTREQQACRWRGRQRRPQRRPSPRCLSFYSLQRQWRRACLWWLNSSVRAGQWFVAVARVVVVWNIIAVIYLRQQAVRAEGMWHRGSCKRPSM